MINLHEKRWTMLVMALVQDLPIEKKQPMMETMEMLRGSVSVEELKIFLAVSRFVIERVDVTPEKLVSELRVYLNSEGTPANVEDYVFESDDPEAEVLAVIGLQLIDHLEKLNED